MREEREQPLSKEIQKLCCRYMKQNRGKNENIKFQPYILIDYSEFLCQVIQFPQFFTQYW